MKDAGRNRMTRHPLTVAGDNTTGMFVPEDVRRPTFTRLALATIRQLERVRGLTATASDVLDELGYALAVPGSVLELRSEIDRPAVGHVLTLRYLPERNRAPNLRESEIPRLAHYVLFEMAEPGDLVVIEATGLDGISVFGGMASLAARRAGIAGCIIDGGVRDLSDIRELGMPVWSRHITPVTGKWRFAAMAINAPICCGSVQVRAGDLALADETGVCFIPNEIAVSVAERVLDVAAQEASAYRNTQGP